MLKPSEPEYVYYNSHAISTQNYSKGISDDAVARISEDRTTSIINDISLYNMSIVRFDCVGIKDIPIFIPMIETGQNDPTKTVYRCSLSVSISNGTGGAETFTTHQNLMFQSQLKNLPLPPSPAQRPDYNNEFYYVYTFYHMVKLVNKLFFDCHTDLQQQINDFAVDPITLTNKAPEMAFNPDTKKFTIYFDERGYGKDGIPQDLTNFINYGSILICIIYFLIFKGSLMKILKLTNNILNLIFINI
jgi:hypothetical protein